MHDHLAATSARVDALTALAPDWHLPRGADRHRKYHLLGTHLTDGAYPSTLTRNTLLAGVTIGSWLHRQLTTWPTLHPGQHHLPSLGLTPENNPLTPLRRTFGQTVQFLEVFLWSSSPRPPWSVTACLSRSRRTRST
ncbi:hypothetical protein [Streptomyces sp. NPDC020571]|uniref:hypothetical protein n=1 Tax=unclassified Streptomyces TaxID=2593676 RepID=UPI00378B9E31